MIRKFRARTRLRGETAYHDANWEIVEHGKHKSYRVTFMDGPHIGDSYPASMCAIARDENWKIGENLQKGKNE